MFHDLFFLKLLILNIIPFIIMFHVLAEINAHSFTIGTWSVFLYSHGDTFRTIYYT